jgi:DNA-binding Lrp family transcriptional regulator
VEKKELVLLSHFRNDARRNLTKISRSTGIPVSTIFDKLRAYEKGLIKKHTSILDFGKMGYDVRVQLILKVRKEDKDSLKDFLMKHLTVNSFYKVNNGFDYMVESVFKTMNEYYQFTEMLDSFGIQKKHEFFVLQELRRESFLDNSDLVAIMD